MLEIERLWSPSRRDVVTGRAWVWVSGRDFGWQFGRAGRSRLIKRHGREVLWECFGIIVLSRCCWASVCSRMHEYRTEYLFGSVGAVACQDRRVLEIRDLAAGSGLLAEKGRRASFKCGR